MLSLNVMQAAVSSVNFGSLTAPKRLEEARATAARSVTGRFTKIIRDIEFLLFCNSIRLLFAARSYKLQPCS